MIQTTDRLEDRGKPTRFARREPSNRTARAITSDLNSPLRFLAAFVREPLTVGAFWPSSMALSQVVVDSCDFEPGDTVVELGPGTGAFTGPILRRMSGWGRLVVMEINRSYVAVLRRRYPRCEVVHDSADRLLRHVGHKQADCIVSGLAWGNMFPRTQDRILKAILDSLAPNGQFVTFGYVHAIWFPTTLRFRRRLFRHFNRVTTTPIVWRNLPPAFVYRCWRD